LFAGIGFLQSAKADFACVAANLFAGIGFLQSAKADFACVAANSFAGNIRRGLVIRQGFITLFF
ncbi:hypothetical protein ON021_04350, partial [Microcoleus sp. HI-ES]|nr:hypothetical protein [Microcoleus sp. HI-ES]